MDNMFNEVINVLWKIISTIGLLAWEFTTRLIQYLINAMFH